MGWFAVADQNLISAVKLLTVLICSRGIQWALSIYNVQRTANNYHVPSKHVRMDPVVDQLPVYSMYNFGGC